MAVDASWLITSEEDRRRMREVERSVTGARKAAFWATVSVFPFLVTAHGWWLIGCGVAFGAYSAFTDYRYRRSARPELWMFSLTMMTQVTLAVGAAFTGGPTSPAIILMVISMASMPARYGTRGMVVGTAFSGVCLAFASLSAGVDALLAHRDIPLGTLAAGLAVLAYGNALRQSEGRQRQAAILDPLTGLLNRTNLEERFEEVRQVAVARRRPLAVVALDLDHFKQVNDRLGHQTGDAVLVDAAYALRGALREFELVYRVGGEEFVVILPGVDRTRAEEIGDRLRRAVAEARPGGQPVTTSVGVAIAEGDDIALTAQMAAADRALYAAKAAGRNRVVAIDLSADSAAAGEGRHGVDGAGHALAA